MKGSYLLIIKFRKSSIIRVGSLGNLNFKKGFYVYIGSAMNGIEQRLGRHLRKNKKIFWHIDYLLNNENAEIKKVIYKESDKKEECKIAEKISKFGEPIEDFGCSDCKCKSHLYKIKNLDNIKKLDKFSYFFF